MSRIFEILEEEHQARGVGVVHGTVVDPISSGRMLIPQGTVVDLRSHDNTIIRELREAVRVDHTLDVEISHESIVRGDEELVRAFIRERLSHYAENSMFRGSVVD